MSISGHRCRVRSRIAVLGLGVGLEIWDLGLFTSRSSDSNLMVLLDFKADAMKRTPPLQRSLR